MSAPEWQGGYSFHTGARRIRINLVKEFVIFAKKYLFRSVLTSRIRITPIMTPESTITAVLTVGAEGKERYREKGR